MRRRESGPWVAGIVALAAMLVALLIAFAQLLPSAGGDFCLMHGPQGGYTPAGSSAEPERSPRTESRLSLVPLEHQCVYTIGDEQVGVYGEGPGWWPAVAVGAFALILVLSILTPAIRNARARRPAARTNA